VLPYAGVTATGARQATIQILADKSPGS
jgi:hypothetical protein